MTSEKAVWSILLGACHFSTHPEGLPKHDKGQEAALRPEGVTRGGHGFIQRPKKKQAVSDSEWACPFRVWAQRREPVTLSTSLQTTVNIQRDP